MTKTILAGLLGCALGCSQNDLGSVPGAMEAMKSADSQERATAVNVLKSYGPDAHPAVDALIGTLTDSDRGVRLSAVYALAAVGTEASPALPALIHILGNDPDSDMRLAAAYAIPAVSSPDDSPISKLEVALDDPDPRVRAEADAAIRKLELAAKHRNYVPSQPKTEPR